MPRTKLVWKTNCTVIIHSFFSKFEEHIFAVLCVIVCIFFPILSIISHFKHDLILILLFLGLSSIFLDTVISIAFTLQSVLLHVLHEKFGHETYSYRVGIYCATYKPQRGKNCNHQDHTTLIWMAQFQSDSGKVMGLFFCPYVCKIPPLSQINSGGHSVYFWFSKTVCLENSSF